MLSFCLWFCCYSVGIWVSFHTCHIDRPLTDFFWVKKNELCCLPLGLLHGNERAWTSKSTHLNQQTFKQDLFKSCYFHFCRWLLSWVKSASCSFHLSRPVQNTWCWDWLGTLTHRQWYQRINWDCYWRKIEIPGAKRIMIYVPQLEKIPVCAVMIQARIVQD